MKNTGLKENDPVVKALVICVIIAITLIFPFTRHLIVGVFSIAVFLVCYVAIPLYVVKTIVDILGLGK